MDLANNLVIALLMEEDYRRNFMRISRKMLRDSMNPFDVPDSHFKQFYRLDKASVHDMIDNLRNFVPTSQIPLHIKVLSTFHFLATGSYQNPIGSNCWISLSQSSVSRAITQVCSAISINFMPRWVKFPASAADKSKIKQGFYEKWGARGIIGAIDGTHVEIIAPSVADEHHPPFVYINRKGKHSINVMLICDATCKIVACTARYPGSCHDAAIWQMSNIRNHLHRNYENGDHSSHLLVDSGYPLEPWLFTPIANPEANTPEFLFNIEHISVRNVIERTNGILKGRFKCLSRFRTLMYHPAKAAHIINTCVVLHNVAIDANVQLPLEEIEYREANEAENIPIIQNNYLGAGRQVRHNYILRNIRE